MGLFWHVGVVRCVTVPTAGSSEVSFSFILTVEKFQEYAALAWLVSSAHTHPLFVRRAGRDVKPRWVSCLHLILVPFLGRMRYAAL